MRCLIVKIPDQPLVDLFLQLLHRLLVKSFAVIQSQTRIAEYVPRLLRTGSKASGAFERTGRVAARRLRGLFPLP